MGLGQARQSPGAPGRLGLVTPRPPAFTDGGRRPWPLPDTLPPHDRPRFRPGRPGRSTGHRRLVSPPGLSPVGRPVGTAWRSDVDAAGDPVSGVPLFGGRSPTERALPRPVRSRVRRPCCRRRPGWGCPTKGGGCPPAEAISRLRLNRAAGRTPCTRRGGVTPRTVFPRESPPRDGPTEPSPAEAGVVPSRPPTQPDPPAAAGGLFPGVVYATRRVGAGPAPSQPPARGRLGLMVSQPRSAKGGPRAPGCLFRATGVPAGSPVAAGFARGPDSEDPSGLDPVPRRPAR